MRKAWNFLWRKFKEHRRAALRYVCNSPPGIVTYFVSVAILIGWLHMTYVVALPIAFLLQFFISQFMHSRLTFRVGRLSRQASRSYFTSFATVSLAEYLLAIVLVELVGTGELFASIAVWLIGGFVSFFFTMIIMYGDRDD